MILYKVKKKIEGKPGPAARRKNLHIALPLKNKRKINKRKIK